MAPRQSDTSRHAAVLVAGAKSAQCATCHGNHAPRPLAGAFGQPGVERVMWMLNAELKLAMALAGQPNLGTITRRLVRKHVA